MLLQPIHGVSEDRPGPGCVTGADGPDFTLTVEEARQRPGHLGKPGARRRPSDFTGQQEAPSPVAAPSRTLLPGVLVGHSREAPGQPLTRGCCQPGRRGLRGAGGGRHRRRGRGAQAVQSNSIGCSSHSETRLRPGQQRTRRRLLNPEFSAFSIARAWFSGLLLRVKVMCTFLVRCKTRPTLTGSQRWAGGLLHVGP